MHVCQLPPPVGQLLFPKAGHHPWGWFGAGPSRCPEGQGLGACPYSAPTPLQMPVCSPWGEAQAGEGGPQPPTTIPQHRPLCRPLAPHLPPPPAVGCRGGGSHCCPSPPSRIWPIEIKCCVDGLACLGFLLRTWALLPTGDS